MSMQDTGKIPNKKPPSEERSKLNSALRSVMSSRDGRFVLHWILDTCGLEKSTFNPDVAVMAYSEGRRSIGIRLLARMKEVSPDYLLTMREEENE